MDKNFDPKTTEEATYRMWESGGYFTPAIDPKKKPFTILLPLPNANDPLHMGHAMFTVQDILIRYHRMKGDPTLWLPGGDHAGIETQYVFEKKLAKEGKSRFQFDRDTLYKMIADFVEQNKNINRDQMKRLGFSLDWTRYHYSLEPKIVATVLDTFKKMHTDGLIYRDDRLVNYCTKDGTGFSDLEAVNQEIDGMLYFIKYAIQGSNNEFITVATTRPETMFGDAAIMVHPLDKRYVKFHEKNAVIPIDNRAIPIITDTHVDRKFGTGAVKVTPMHDFNDYEIGKRHNLLKESAQIIGFDGKLNITAINAPITIQGLKVKAAREETLRLLKENGQLVDQKLHKMTVKVCYRCNTILEPLPIPQWYVKTKSLAAKAIEAVKSGKTKIFPKKRFEKMYFNWMNNILDWNISRQIVWGPRIPVWYKTDGQESRIWVSFLDRNKKLQQGPIRQWLENDISLEEIKQGIQRVMVPIYDAPENRPEIHIGETPPDGNWIQDTDTFDTWFLSSQWPMTTLGFPDSEDFKYFYPTSVLDTMWDILFFWVARMMMMGLYRTGNVPFELIHLHSRVVDAHGQKMSKSKGNVMNPIDMVDKYGADALRFALVFGAAPGSDIAVSEDKIRGMRNFANKIWNAARFVSLMQSVTSRGEKDASFTKEIRSIVKKVTASIEKYRFNAAADLLYESFWHWYCDVAIEEAKTGLISKSALEEGLLTYLKLLHPFMPFVTEEIWSKLPHEETTPLIISSWPR